MTETIIERTMREMYNMGFSDGEIAIEVFGDRSRKKKVRIWRNKNGLPPTHLQGSGKPVATAEVVTPSAVPDVQKENQAAVSTESIQPEPEAQDQPEQEVPEALPETDSARESVTEYSVLGKEYPSWCRTLFDNGQRGFYRICRRKPDNTRRGMVPALIWV